MAEKESHSTERSIPEVIGYGANDLIYSYLNGDATASLDLQQNVFVEAREVAEKIFPYQIAVGKRFKVIYEPSEEFEMFFTSYLTGDRVRGLDGKQLYSSYSHASLGQFIKWIADGLLKDGIVYIGVYWDTIDEWNSEIIVPIKFTLLPKSTIRVSQNHAGEKSYRQVFNPLVAPKHYSEDFLGKTIDLNEENLVIINYPFGQPPVRQAHEASVEQRQLSRMSVERLGAFSSSDITYHGEKLRYLRQSELRHKEKLARAKVRKIFRLPVDHWLFPDGTLDPDVTDYYRAYRYIEYLKYLHEFREFLLAQYNQQITQKIRDINNLPDKLTLTYVGNQPTLSEIKSQYKRYCDGVISYKELVEKLNP